MLKPVISGDNLSLVCNKSNFLITVTRLPPAAPCAFPQRGTESQLRNILTLLVMGWNTCKWQTVVLHSLLHKSQLHYSRDDVVVFAFFGHTPPTDVDRVALLSVTINVMFPI